MVMTTPETACAVDGRLVDPGRDQSVDRLPQLLGHAAPGGQLRREGREDVTAVKGGADVVDADAGQCRSLPTRMIAASAVRPTTGASSPLSGARNTWPPAVTTTISREVPTPGSTTATCTVPAGK